MGHPGGNSRAATTMQRCSHFRGKRQAPGGLPQRRGKHSHAALGGQRFGKLDRDAGNVPSHRIAATQHQRRAQQDEDERRLTHGQ